MEVKQYLLPGLYIATDWLFLGNFAGQFFCQDCGGFGDKVPEECSV
jgi:hypothetical protein